ncbi:MAG: outer membrane protein assembly factor BamA [Hyphomicrobiales bacterium]|nr:MAG: outer membrane protein assembly factor BamA [Hyphomicrobiales bacterium]
MIDPTKLVRSAAMALALMFLAPLTGVGGAVLGVGAAQAQTAPLVASVLFEGNQRFSDANLVAMIDTQDRGTVDEAGLARDVQSIRQAYQDVGYSDVQVTTRLEPVADGRVRVIFVVVEGNRAGIAAINFTGNNNIGAWNLKSVIRTKETGWLSWLLRDDNYTQAQLDIDRELIRQYYSNHGYPDAQVTSAVAEYNAERNGYFISFTVVEGERYAFGDIGVETSIAGLDANNLTGSIRTRKGDRFSANDLARSAQDMAVEATNLGYPFADVRPRIVRDPGTGSFSVTYLVDEGQRLYVERINITGNEKTRDFVIRRELPFSEGDPFNRALVTQGKGNIESLGFFSVVAINAEQGSSADKVVLNIAVTEQSTGDYGVTAGYDSQAGILGELSLTERNFLGRGQFLRASIGASQGGKSIDFSFTEPYFMGLKMSAGFDVYHRITDENATNVYGTTSTGAQMRFGLPVTRDLQAQVFFGGDRTVVTDTVLGGSTEILSAGTYDKGWVGYSLNYDGTDDRKRPTEGFAASLTQTYVGLGYNFIKTEAKARYFMPLNSDLGLVGSVKVQGGIINNFGGTAVNSLENFTYGNTLVRGFVQRGIGPKTSLGEIVGYTAYAGASAEMTFPIPGLPESYGLSGALFADAAVVSGVGELGTGTLDGASTANPLKSSVGASVIWDSPFGPLRGDMAWILSQSTTDSTTKVCSSVYCPAFALTLQTLL